MAKGDTAPGTGGTGTGRDGLPSRIPTPPQSNPLESLYQSALKTNAGDYDSIMGQYRDFAGRGAAGQLGGVPGSTGNITPQELKYKESPEFSKAMGIYGNMARTGGVSDQASIRERGISPIRSIYANAQQNLNRQRVLQGGYSPGYTAATTKMARDLSGQVSDVTTVVNAQLAQMIAEGKRSGAAGYAGLAAQRNNMMNEMTRLNADNKLRADELNKSRGIDDAKFNASSRLQGIQGQQSLYGTTPALANTFGSQVLNAVSQISQNQAAQPPIRTDSKTGRPIIPKPGTASG